MEWGGGGGYLGIQFAKKWFWGMLLRKIDKQFDEPNLGAVRLYHKSHI